MTKRWIWPAFSAFLVLAMVLSACGTKTPTPTTQTTTPTTTTPTTTTPTTTATTTPKTTAPATTTAPPTTSAGPEQPQYGGSITVILGNAHSTSYFDPCISAVGGYTLGPIYDKLVSADWGKGPEGTNQFNFSVSYIPEVYRTGVIAESWEIKDLNTLIYHIRKGINFQSKAPANGKQLTSADVVYSYRRGQQDTRFTSYNFANWTDDAAMATKKSQAKSAGRTDAEWDAWVAELKSINYPFYAPSYYLALDAWTVKVRTLNPGSTTLDGGSWLFVYSTESAGVNLDDYKNACGTGAFIPVDSVPDSSITWTRNPNYWMPDPNHPQNKLPYVDKLVGLIIVDQATQIAALRTHKIDIAGVTWDKQISISQTNPELLYKKQSPTGAIVLFMRTDIAPFSDIRVRQALCMGVDRDSIIANYYKGNAIVDAWPDEPGNAGYVPVSQMPPDVKQLFEYHPDKAKALLAAAGFPNGFKTEVVIYQSDPDVELLTLVAEQLKSINIDATIKVVESGTHTAVLYGLTYPQMIYSYWGNASPQAVLGSAHGGVVTSIYNFSKVVDPLAVTAYFKWAAMTDKAAASDFLAQEYLREDLLCWEVPLPTAVGFTMWAPYLKGQKGELNMGLTAEMGTTERYKFFWVDAKLRSTIVGK